MVFTQEGKFTTFTDDETKKDRSSTPVFGGRFEIVDEQIVLKTAYQKVTYRIIELTKKRLVIELQYLDHVKVDEPVRKKYRRSKDQEADSGGGKKKQVEFESPWS